MTNSGNRIIIPINYKPLNEHGVLWLCIKGKWHAFDREDYFIRHPRGDANYETLCSVPIKRVDIENPMRNSPPSRVEELSSEQIKHIVDKDVVDLDDYICQTCVVMEGLRIWMK
jgi:hypothetical protein